jgi:hypothetical protein
MKVIIWIKTEDFDDFVDGKNVKYWNSQPHLEYTDTDNKKRVKSIVSVTIDSDRYQQLKDNE